jgi:hypothetical protein
MYLDNPHYVCTTVTGMATTSPAVRDDRQTGGDPLAELVLGCLLGILCQCHEVPVRFGAHCCWQLADLEAPLICGRR